MESKKLMVAIISLEGDALAWYPWSENRQKITDWNNLKIRIFVHFRPSHEGGLCVRFLSIKQEGTMAEYCQTFEAWSAPLPHLAEEILESKFLNGFDPVMMAEVLALEPNGFDPIMKKA